MAEQFTALDADPENVRAWRLFQLCATRFLFDGHGMGLAFDRLTHDDDEATYTDLLERCALIYNRLYPVPEPHGA